MFAKIKNVSGHLFTIEGLIHVVMLLVALGSFGTISDWLSHSHHWLTTYSVAAGLSLGLVSAAVMLSKIDFNDKQARVWMTTAVILVALLSGTIQSIAYYDAAVCPVAIVMVDNVAVREQQPCADMTIGVVAKSVLQGYGFPLIFEGLLAYASSVYELSQKKKRAAEIADSSNLDKRMDAKIYEAVNQIDLSSMQHKINEMAMSVVERKLGHAFDRLVSTDNAVDKLTNSVNAMVSEVSEVVRSDSPVVSRSVNPVVNSVNPVVRTVSAGGDNLSEVLSEVVSSDKSVNRELSEVSELSDELSAVVSGDSDNLSEVSDVVSPVVSGDKSVNAFVSLADQIVNVVSEHLTLGATDIHRLIGGDTVCSRSNVYNYLKQLEADGRIIKVGTKFQTA